jgi:hypothetical protein
MADHPATKEAIHANRNLNLLEHSGLPLLYFRQAAFCSRASSKVHQMLRRLLILALCGMPRLWADVCDGLSAGSPEAADVFGSNKPQSFKLSVMSGGAGYRVTVRPLWQLTRDGRPVVDDPHKGDIEVARCQDGVRLQVLPITADQDIAFGSTFDAQDLNFDGYLDFSVLTEYSGTGGDVRSYWVYDPHSGIFVQNEFTRELRCGSVEVTSKYGGCRGAAFIDFDPEKREVSRRYFGGAMGGCPNTGEGEGERYRVVNNRLILIHKQEFELISRGGVFQYCAVTLSDLVDGTMRVIEVRRFDAQGRRVK